MQRYTPSSAEFVKVSLKHGRTPAATVSIGRMQYGDAFARAVEFELVKPRSPANTLRSVHAKAQRYLRHELKEAGIEPVRILQKEQHMQAAIQTLITHVDTGKKPSALSAATQSGLDKRQSKKLAYGSTVKRETVEAAVDLRPDSPFVQKLLLDAGMTGLVVNGHVSLSKLAGVLTNVHRSLAERVEQLEAAVIMLAGEQQRQRELLAAQGITGNSRGAWHAQARALRGQGKTGNQIARLLGKSPNAVEKVLSRKPPACEAEAPSDTARALH